MALGGSYASGTDSFAAAIANNTNAYGAQGASSVVAGYLSKATGSQAVALGYIATASGSRSFALQGGTASGYGSFAMGDGCIASNSQSFAFGNYAISAIYGKTAFSSGLFAASGDAQFGQIVLRVETTSATPAVLTSNNSAASATNQLVLPNGGAFAFSALVVARQQNSTGAYSAAWKIEGLIRRGTSAGSTWLVNKVITVLSNEPGWSMDVSADITNGALAFTGTGAAATNIRWVATVQTSEVTYA